MSSITKINLRQHNNTLLPLFVEDLGRLMYIANMQIIIPMAGSGERFRKAGYDMPKPLIEINGKPMIEYVVNLFPGEEKFLFICNTDHVKKSGLKDMLLELKPRATIVEIEPHKRGPAYSLTLDQTHKEIADNDEIIVNYCDFSMRWDYQKFKESVHKSQADSASVCYHGFHPHLLGPNLYAGVRVDKNMRALEVQEKHSFTENKMDTWFQTGTFYFKSGSLLKKYSDRVIAENVRTGGEHYISHLFNFMIQDKCTSFVYPVEYFCQLGTPEDLEQYKQWSEWAKQKAEFANIRTSMDAETYQKVMKYFSSSV